MPILRFCALFLALMLLTIICFSSIAMGASPARHPQGKQILSKKIKRPEIVVRLGKPYIAELHPVKK